MVVQKQNGAALISQHAREIWWAGVNAVSAHKRVKEFVQIDENELCFGEHRVGHNNYQNIVVVGAGKSAGDMAVALEELLLKCLPREKLFHGLVNVPDDRVAILEHIRVAGCRPVGFNLPTQRVLESTDQLIKLLQGADANDLVIGLFTGGGSALLEQPRPPVTLLDLQVVTKLLSDSGASIEELNVVRSELSAVKGGRLARLIPCRQIVSLLISDVLGDPISAIASGPTVAHNSFDNRSGAMEVLDRYVETRDAVPASVLKVLSFSKYVSGKDLTPTIPSIPHFVIANNQMAVAAAHAAAVAKGYYCQSETDFSSDPVDDVARRLVKQLEVGIENTRRTGQKGCFISGGEPTISLSVNPGLGGRNQHLILKMLETVLSEKTTFGNVRCSLLSAGTDGEDGNTDVAGAQIDSDLLQRLAPVNANRDIQTHLLEANSHVLLNDWKCLFNTENTQTNVCDLRVLLWEFD